MRTDKSADDRSPGRFEVVHATAAQIPDAAAVLGEAFSRDPHVLGWLSDGDVTGPLTRLWRQILRETLSAGGHAYLAVRPGNTQIVGVALWEAPGHKVTLRQMIPGVTTYLRVFGRQFGNALVSEFLAHRAQPSSPHWYLKAVGALPEVQGEGVGTVLLNERIPEIDREHAEAYLEASTEDLVPYYARFGFHSLGPVACRGTLPAIGMLRPAQG